jgi:acetyl-CoA synthetase
MKIMKEQLRSLGLTQPDTDELFKQIQISLNQSDVPIWQNLSAYLIKKSSSFSIHLQLFTFLFPDWRNNPETAPVWVPNKNQIQTTNIYHLMQEINCMNISALHQWSTKHYVDFWKIVVNKLSIVFKKKPSSICHFQNEIESPSWFDQAKMNIVDSCYNAHPSKVALYYQDDKNESHSMTYAELNQLSNRVANSLIFAGFKPNDAIAIASPMNHFSIAIYLGIIKMGGVVVSIADSFSGEEMTLRFQISHAKAVFTQSFNQWSGKKIPLYEKIANASSIPIIMIHDDVSDQNISIRAQDHYWNDFLIDNDQAVSVACDPMQACNILFSSGTTATPKAIVWNHTTAIKAASDGYFHQNIQPDDIIAWPSNLGWMMGPWLIFAGLINKASIAIYPFAPKDREFGQFIQNTKVTILGVVPTLVNIWRQTKCMENLDWHHIKIFTSTGECSNPEDMFYLMYLAQYKPIIEYCGGTEIGGGYVTSTVIQNNYPSLFSTKALGLDFLILNDKEEISDTGEVALIPPSIGLSTELLNANHHDIYFSGMPQNQNTILRRHGDAIKELPNGYFSLLGRSDDSMKLGGIKISAAEIERSIAGIPFISEVAAIATQIEGACPSRLIIFAVTQGNVNKDQTLSLMQKQINSKLNPLFKIHDLIFIKELPKTASNKIMRRTLRKQFQDKKF